MSKEEIRKAEALVADLKKKNESKVTVTEESPQVNSSIRLNLKRRSKRYYNCFNCGHKLDREVKS